MKSILPITTILLLHTLFVLTNAYSVTHVDSLMHFFGGIALGLLVSRLLPLAVRKGWCTWPGQLIETMLIVSLVASGAVCWEFYEWLSDRYLGTLFQLTLDDTIKDLALGLSGGIISAAAIYCSCARSGKRWITLEPRWDRKAESPESCDGRKLESEPG
jgi:hypothetical protein